jgi:hypothetical protein
MATAHSRNGTSAYVSPAIGRFRFPQDCNFTALLSTPLYQRHQQGTSDFALPKTGTPVLYCC